MMSAAAVPASAMSAPMIMAVAIAMIVIIAPVIGASVVVLSPPSIIGRIIGVVCSIVNARPIPIVVISVIIIDWAGARARSWPHIYASAHPSRKGGSGGRQPKYQQEFSHFISFSFLMMSAAAMPTSAMSAALMISATPLMGVVVVVIPIIIFVVDVNPPVPARAGPLNRFIVLIFFRIRLIVFGVLDGRFSFMHRKTGGCKNEQG